MYSRVTVQTIVYKQSWDQTDTASNEHPGITSFVPKCWTIPQDNNKGTREGVGGIRY